MKKIITVGIVVVLALILGWYLFKISGGGQTTGGDNFNLDNIKQAEKPREMEADDHILGSPQARNTMVAYEDFQCPACANYEPILKSFPTELKDTKVVFRHFPLTSLHKNAVAAAYASEAAAAQGKFFEFVDLVYGKQSDWSSLADPVESFVGIARDAGVANLEQFRSDLTGKKYKSRVEKDVREGYSLNLQGTPALYFNGVKLELAGLDGIKQQVDKLYK